MSSEAKKPESVQTENKDQSITASFLLPIETKNIRVLFSPSRRKAVKKIIISIEGEFSIAGIRLLYDRVKDIFEYYDVVHIEFNNIVQIDLSGIQLFYAMKHLYENGTANKRISMDAKLAKEEKILIQKCGFNNLFAANAAVKN